MSLLFPHPRPGSQILSSCSPPHYYPQVLELQHTLADLSARVESVKEENMNLRSENQILGQYIEKLMISSPVFHSSSPPTVERNKRANQLPAAAAGAATPSSGLGLQTFPFEENSGVVSEEEFP
ncbi:unnamed protein product [Schistocephalus solidus]|uniref:Short coiled-coil protein n=1 Tax=Schistocephalus solidus TaxID=70667 RepID=A0A183SDR0_SCHSO|nr:unnamed protein product [Schistocephalus solidus]